MSFLRKLFGGGRGKASVDAGLKVLYFTPEDEKIAQQLVLASHRKDLGAVKKIGEQLNREGGLERMKLIYYRAEDTGGDGRWIEFMWSGIGEWMG